MRKITNDFFKVLKESDIAPGKSSVDETLYSNLNSVIETLDNAKYKLESESNWYHQLDNTTIVFNYENLLTDFETLLERTKEFQESLKIENNINESTNSDSWWEQNWERAINYVDSIPSEDIVEEFYDGDWDMYECNTGKHVALDILNILGPNEFESRIKELEEE